MFLFVWTFVILCLRVEEIYLCCFCFDWKPTGDENLCHRCQITVRQRVMLCQISPGTTLKVVRFMAHFFVNNMGIRLVFSLIKLFVWWYMIIIIFFRDHGLLYFSVINIAMCFFVLLRLEILKLWLQLSVFFPLGVLVCSICVCWCNA